MRVNLVKEETLAANFSYKIAESMNACLTEFTFKDRELNKLCFVVELTMSWVLASVFTKAIDQRLRDAIF
jgi:hypothetical protein